MTTPDEPIIGQTVPQDTVDASSIINQPSDGLSEAASEDNIANIVIPKGDKSPGKEGVPTKNPIQRPQPRQENGLTKWLRR